MSTDNPLVSIIVPVYNVELFIDECIIHWLIKHCLILRLF